MRSQLYFSLDGRTQSLSFVSSFYKRSVWTRASVAWTPRYEPTYLFSWFYSRVPSRTHATHNQIRDYRCLRTDRSADVSVRRRARPIRRLLPIRPGRVWLLFFGFFVPDCRLPIGVCFYGWLLTLPIVCRARNRCLLIN